MQSEPNEPEKDSPGNLVAHSEQQLKRKGERIIEVHPSDKAIVWWFGQDNVFFSGASYGTINTHGSNLHSAAVMNGPYSASSSAITPASRRHSNGFGIKRPATGTGVIT